MKSNEINFLKLILFKGISFNVLALFNDTDKFN